jgi:hypothetical protein
VNLHYNRQTRILFFPIPAAKRPEWEKKHFLVGVGSAKSYRPPTQGRWRIRTHTIRMVRQMSRFVILYHDTPQDYGRGPHFDLMLEGGAALRTYALPHWLATGETVSCEQLADHRLAYLDYEGPISGGRGQVTRHDAGEYEIVKETSQTLVLRLHGQRLKGTLTLQRLADSQQWGATWQPALSDA